jgi:hypothetical protein
MAQAIAAHSARTDVLSSGRTDFPSDSPEYHRQIVDYARRMSNAVGSCGPHRAASSAASGSSAHDPLVTDIE